jgi:hypothetical protein
MNESFLRWVLLANISVLLIPSYLASLYVDRAILPFVESQLMNCKIVTNSRAFWGETGFFARGQRFISVNLALTSTRMLAKKGWVDIDQVDKISMAHRRWICLPMRIGTLSMFVMTFLFMLDKSC